MKIVLGTLKDKKDELATFLEPRLGTKPSLAGDTMEIEDEGIREGVKPRHVKTYIKRFLYMNGIRKNYRVFVAGKELTVQEIELDEEEEEEKKPAKEEKEVEEKEEEVEAEEKEPEEEKESAKPEPEKPAAAEEAEEKPEETEEKPKKATRKPRATKKKQAEES